MFRVKQLVWAMGCVSVLGGCAWHQGGDKQGWDVKPVMQVKHTSDTPETMYRLGRYYQGKADYAGAIAAYKKTLTKDPGHVEAHNGLGVAYSLSGQHDLAVQYFRKGIKLMPTAAHLKSNLGYVLFMRGQEREAADELKQALDLDTSNRQAQRNLAAVYEKMGLQGEAAQLAVTSNPHANPHLDPTLPAIASASDTAPVSPPVGEAAATTIKQEVRETPDFRLVQVAPYVFELRAAEADAMTTVLKDKIVGKTGSFHSSSSLDPKEVRIEVSNGNGISRLARQVSSFLGHNGFEKAHLTNWPPFLQAQTEIHYQPGYHVLADKISEIMPKQARTVESHELRRGIHVRVLLGKDIAGEVAYFNNLRPVRTARLITSAAVGENAGE